MIAEAELRIVEQFRLPGDNRPAVRSLAGQLIEIARLSQFGAKGPARGTSRVFASDCCRPIHRGIGPVFNTLSMERTMAAKKKKAAKKGGAKKKK
jgi:hypothetical protein